ncbi:MAG: molybdopterin-dependent oxidoreductase [Solirubrobacterales bacterium]
MNDSQADQVTGGRPPAALPIENNRPRVQRLVDELAAVHLELEPPVREHWTVSVGGLVARRLELSLADLHELGAAAFVADFHCVWGWSRPRVNWTGVPTRVVLDAAGVRPAATHVRFGAADSPYASCVTLAQACDGLLATELEGEPLPPLNGGPLRWLQPHYLWGYKGVKWLAAIELTDHMDAGPWETKVGDIDGEVPQGLIDRFAALETVEKATGPADE